MAIPTYDWTEPSIRAMVESNHTPIESVFPPADGSVVNTRVECDFCGQPWPCAVIEDLRAWYDEEGNGRFRAADQVERQGKR